MTYAIYSTTYPQSDCLGLVDAKGFSDAIDAFVEFTNVTEVVCEYDDLVAEELPVKCDEEGAVIITSDRIDYK